jgi:hypothetical protein
VNGPPIEAAWGQVEAGAYRIEAAQGLTPGTYRVLITSQAPEGDPDDQAKTVAPFIDPIPEKFNTSTTLQAEVKAGGSNTFDFPLTTK